MKKKPYFYGDEYIEIVKKEFPPKEAKIIIRNYKKYIWSGRITTPEFTKKELKYIRNLDTT